MGVVERVGHAATIVGDVGARHPVGITVVQQAAGVGAVDVVHGDPQLAVGLAPVVHADDVRMPQRRSDVGLAVEPLAVLGVRRHLGPQHLQRVVAGQARMLDEVDLTHAARAEAPDDGVAGERRSPRPTAWANRSPTRPLRGRGSVRRRRRPRETQISIIPASRSGAVSKVSRCSTAPASTRVRHVPQNPCWHEYGACTASRLSADSSVSSAATRTVRPVDATDTENSVPSTTGGAAKRSKCSSTSSRPASAVRSAVNAGAGPHAYTVVPPGQSPSRSSAVGRPASSSVRISMRSPKTRQLLEERQRVATAAGVDHRPLHAESLGLREHRQDRRDSDPARDETEPLGRRAVARHRQRERVARTAGGDRCADGQIVVDLDRPPAATRDAAHRDSVGVGTSGSPHSEYCRTRPLGRCTSRWAPGRQRGSGPPCGAASVSAITS